MTNIEYGRIWCRPKMTNMWPKMANDIWWYQAAAWNQFQWFENRPFKLTICKKWLVSSRFLVEIPEKLTKNDRKWPKIILNSSSYLKSMQRFEIVFFTYSSDQPYVWVRIFDSKMAVFFTFLVKIYSLLGSQNLSKILKVHQNFIYKFYL